MADTQKPAVTRDAALTWDIPAEMDPDTCSSMCTAARSAFLEASATHIDLLAAQLLEAQGVQNTKIWGPLIAHLAREAAAMISPGSLSSITGEFDLRHVIDIIPVVVPGTELPHVISCAIDGPVLNNKTVAHKRMRSLIQNPRVLILSGALDPIGMETSKLSSIDALGHGMDSERSKLRAWVDEIVAIGVDVLLIEQGSPSSHAVEMLLEAGVSLVTGVKLPSLRRIASCLGATVKPIASPLDDSHIGRCQVFEIFQSPLHPPRPPPPPPPPPGEDPPPSEGSSTTGVAAAAAAPTPLTMFKGCNRGVGSTIVLGGSTKEELDKVWKVARSTAYASLFNCVEAAYLGVEFAATTLLASSAIDEVSMLAKNVARESVESTLQERANAPITYASPHCSTYGGVKEMLLQDSTADFDRLQQLWLSISARNPLKSVLCEPPHLHSMPYYKHDEGDLSIAEFIRAAAPVNRKCPHPQCGDGAGLHLRSFYHGNSLITLSSYTSPIEKELPLGVWLWARSLGDAIAVSSEEPNGHSTNSSSRKVHRVSLGFDAREISFAHLLTLLLDAHHLRLANRSSRSFVHYLGQGRTIICLHHSSIKPYSVRLPPPRLYVDEKDSERWVQEEVKKLTEEADEVFDALEKAVEAFSEESEAATNCVASVRDVRSMFMKIVRTVSPQPQNRVASLHAINHLQRNLASLIQQLDIATAILQARAFQQQQAAEQAAPIATGSTRQNLSHTRTNSGASSGQPVTPPEEVIAGGLASQRSHLLSYLAPKLIDAAVETPPQPTAKENPPLESIPTGLVARYISHFEDQQDKSESQRDEDHSEVVSKRLFGPSTTIELRGSGFPLRRTTTVDVDIQEDLENKLERLREGLSQLTVDSEPHQQVPSAYNFLSSRRVFIEGASADQPPIYDEEPVSVVAFFLSSGQYQDYVDNAKVTCLAPSEEAEPGTPTKQKDVDQNQTAALSEDEQILRSSVQLDCQMIAEDESIPGSRARFQMTAYYAPHFAALRKLILEDGEASYLTSVARSIPWAAQGGKSNVYFAKSKDDRYVIKQLTKSEKQSVLEYAPDYFKYLQASIASGGTSCLAKILGIYQVQLEYANGRSAPFGKDGAIDFIVMENLFHGCDVKSIYDLKGSERDRYAADNGRNSPATLLDDNLREANRTNPTLVSPVAFKELQQCLVDDTTFLASLGVMDYSLLVGCDKKRQRLVVGLVDYVRQYTWDKQVESWVKKSGLLGGAGKEPTIISPQQYARRFRTAMLSYFTVVPCLGKPPNDIISAEDTKS